MRRSLILVLLAAGAAPGARAQGALGVQGYGYPTGQLGAAARAVGGATAEVDPASLLNPAALAMPSRFSIAMQFEPEFRRTTIGGAEATSSTMRFPTFLATGGVGRFTGGVSFSTFLDRTWENVYADSQVIAGDIVPSTLSAASRGAITDARFAVAYVLNPRIQVGLALHAIAGENRLVFGRTFPDSSGIAGVSQGSTINYTGRAISAGVLYAPTKAFLIGASARFGGGLEARQDGLTLATADVPDRFGASLSWLGIPNTAFSARIERTAWSSMQPLGTAQMTTFDATDIGIGVDVVGPRIAGAPSTARLGYRDRTLPFGVNGDQVSEHGLSGGVAIPLARGRVQIDLSLQRAIREAAGARERAWFVSIGLGVRP